MKKIASFVMCLVLWPLAQGASGIKPGLWEVQVTKQVMDGKEMTAQMAAATAQMQEALAKMTPEQRQQMDRVMGGQKLSDERGQRICISADMAAQDKPVMPANAQCEATKFERKGNKTNYELNCTTAQGSMLGKGESVVDGDTVRSRMDMTVTSARGKQILQTESQMKYLGADCQGLKPMDQLMKELRARPKP